MDSVRSGIRWAAGPLAIGAVLLVSVAIGGSTPVWRTLAAAPDERQEVSYTALDGSLYLAAGNDRGQQRYNPATDTWQSVAELPASFTGIDHVHGVAIGGKIVYAGGLLQWEHPFPVIGNVAIYDPADDTFTSGTDMPSPRAAGGVAAWRGKLIYAGGLGPDGSVARVDAYDPLIDKWTRLADMPRVRDHFQAAVIGDELFAIGGRDTAERDGSIETSDIAAVDVLDLPSDSTELTSAPWRSSVTLLPTLRSGHGVAAVGQCIYVIGGEHTSTGTAGVTGATESYNTVTGVWRALEPLWTPRHGIEAASLGSTIYVAAGGTEAFDYNPTAAHEALDVSEDEPCAALPSEDRPDPDPTPEEEPTAPIVDGGAQSLQGAEGHETSVRLRVKRLAVRPRQLLLRRGARGGRRARIVVVLSRPGRVLMYLPRYFRFSKRLRAGRNTLRLPVRPRGRLLPPGPYQLVAKPEGRHSDRRLARAGFRVAG